MFIINPYAYTSGASSPSQAETLAWEAGIVALGGSVIAADKNIADALIVQMKTRSYYAKIKSFYPFIGAGIANHRMPLIDVVAKGAAANSGFTDADCDTATGLANPTGAAKILNTLIPATAMRSGAAGGMGIGLRAWTNGSAVEPCGCYEAGGTRRYVIDLRTSFESFRWSDVSTAVPQTANPGVTADYYGQATSTTDRKLAKNGSVVAASTTAQGLIPIGTEIRIGGCIDNSGGLTYTKGTYGYWVGTDGSLTNAEIADFYNDIATYLYAATGR